MEMIITEVNDARTRAEASDRKAESDELFRNAPTEVPRHRRADQIRRANKAPSLEEVPFTHDAAIRQSDDWMFVSAVLGIIVILFMRI